jgi:hypothetical protein
MPERWPVDESFSAAAVGLLPHPGDFKVPRRHQRKHVRVTLGLFAANVSDEGRRVVICSSHHANCPLTGLELETALELWKSELLTDTQAPSVHEDQPNGLGVTTFTIRPLVA